MSNKEPESIDYASTLAELEQLVRSLENSELPLEQAMQNFEKGIHLTNQCQKYLSEAEQKVSILMQQYASPADESPHDA